MLSRTHNEPGSLFGSGGCRKYLNRAERGRFLESAQRLPPRECLFCLILGWSGARISEVLALTPAAFDLDAGTVNIITLKRRKAGIVRQVPLPDCVLTQLENVFELRRCQSEPAVATLRMWPESRTTAWRRVKQVMVSAQVTGMQATAKGLRHAFGVSAFQENVPGHLVQRWLGHASPRTTAIYGDVIGADERAFAARMWDAGGSRG